MRMPLILAFAAAFGVAACDATEPATSAAPDLPGPAVAADTASAQDGDADGMNVPDGGAEPTDDAFSAPADAGGVDANGFDAGGGTAGGVDAMLLDADAAVTTAEDADAASLPTGPHLWTSCTSAAECPPDAVCNRGYTIGAGLCTPRSGLGWLCTVDDDCAAGTICVPAGPESDLSECHPTEPYGQACNAELPCAAGQVCNRAYASADEEEDGACVPPGGLGFGCLSDADCAADLRCGKTVEGTRGVCLPKGGPGALCLDSGGCQQGTQCTTLTWAGVGQCKASGAAFPSCSLGGVCPLSTVCVGDGKGPKPKKPSCQPAGVFGSPCVEDADCATHFACSWVLGPASTGTVGLCILRGATGVPCSDPYECAKGFGCRTPFGAGVKACAKLAPEGGWCHTDNDCMSPGTCSTYFGQPACHAGLLQPCTEDADCPADLACVASYGGLDGSCGVQEYKAMWTTGSCYSTACNGCVCCDIIDQGYADWDTTFCSQCVPAPGSRALGQSCGRPEDCATGLTCAQSGAGRVCAPASGEGAPCASNADCGSGLACVTEDDEARCRPTRGQGETCDEAADCLPTLQCQGYGNKRCVTPLKTPCGEDIPCGPGLVCKTAMGGPAGGCTQHNISTGSVCVEEQCGGGCAKWCPSYTGFSKPYVCSQCVPAPGAMPFGDACIDDESCAAGLICGATGKCRFVAQSGDPCGSANDCAAGLLCKANVCDEPGVVGAPCTQDAECADGLRCRPVDGAEPLCQSPGGPGEACDATADCESDLRCLGVPVDLPKTGTPGSCGAPLTAGASCAYTTDCAEDHICGYSSKTCLLDTTGQSCGSDADCSSGFCDSWCGSCQ